MYADTGGYWLNLGGSLPGDPHAPGRWGIIGIWGNLELAISIENDIIRSIDGGRKQ